MAIQSSSEPNIVKRLTIGYLFIGLVIVSATWFSINRIEQEIRETSDFHQDALNSLLEIQTLSNHAAQELFAYLLSGVEEELDDYRLQIDEITRESARFASVAQLSKPGEEAELQRFSEAQMSWSGYVNRAEVLVSRYRDTGEVSSSDFLPVEEALDESTSLIQQLVDHEKQEVALGLQRRDQIVAESEVLLMLVASATVAALLSIGWMMTRTVGGYITRLRELDADLLLRSAALESTDVGVCFATADGDQVVTYVNQALLDISGYDRDEFIGRNCRFLQGENSNEEVVLQMHAAIEERREVNVLLLNYRKDGTTFWNDLHISPVRSDTGEVTHFIGAMHDVTDRMDLEAQAARSQKMEAIGQLAGGVAHDFNNYLTVIQGNADLLRESHPDPDIQLHATQIIEAGDRSAALTRHLLAFSKRQVMMPQTIDLNRVILDLDPLLRRTLGEAVSLETVTGGGLGLVNADRSQIEQVLLNLVVNARDAMPGGGSITVETGNVYLDSEYAARATEVDEGRFVMIAVSDTGSGISEEVLPHIFDPFFSTKESGSSGLGLSTVQGIVGQSAGTIQVYSEAGAGTTFKIYLPRVAGDVTVPQREEVESQADLQGAVLVVEDEEMVRQVTCQMLRSIGLQVFEASDGNEGLAVIEKQGRSIDLLLTDVMLPGMSGRELADRAVEIVRELSVLFMSGYTENGILHHGRLDEGIQFLQKPFTQQQLRRKVAVVMSRGKVVEFKSGA